jgi:hypothetical protein
VLKVWFENDFLEEELIQFWRMTADETVMTNGLSDNGRVIDSGLQ